MAEVQFLVTRSIAFQCAGCDYDYSVEVKKGRPFKDRGCCGTRTELSIDGNGQIHVTATLPTPESFTEDEETKRETVDVPFILISKVKFLGPDGQVHTEIAPPAGHTRTIALDGGYYSKYRFKTKISSDTYGNVSLGEWIPMEKKQNEEEEE